MADHERAHHDLCFGCGLANPFGLALELSTRGDLLDGRFFVKQDHQGADGSAHPGVLAAALCEASVLAAGVTRPRLERFELELTGAAAVGTYVSVAARPEPSAEGATVRVTLSDEQAEEIARATAVLSGEAAQRA